MNDKFSYVKSNIRDFQQSIFTLRTDLDKKLLGKDSSSNVFCAIDLVKISMASLIQKTAKE